MIVQQVGSVTTFYTSQIFQVGRQFLLERYNTASCVDTGGRAGSAPRGLRPDPRSDPPPVLAPQPCGAPAGGQAAAAAGVPGGA